VLKLFRVQIIGMVRRTFASDEDPKDFEFDAGDFEIENYGGGDSYFG